MKLISQYHFLMLKSHGSFTTSVLHKPTFTSLRSNFDSFILLTYEKGLGMSLLNRYFNICSIYITFHSELDNFKKLLSLNGMRRSKPNKPTSRYTDF